MDKKPNSQRIYYLRYLGPDSVLTLIQETRLDGEFGPIVIRCMCEMDCPSPLLVSKIIETSGSSAEELYNVRNTELAHFIINILPLFNPLTFNKDALSFSQEESSDS